MIKPNLAIITNIAEAHIENFNNIIVDALEAAKIAMEGNDNVNC